MHIRNKTKRRFGILLAVFALVIVAGVVVYSVRSSQFHAQLREARDEGLRALENGDAYTALLKIGRYVQRNGDDAETLYAYARARQQVPVEGGKHLTQALSLYTRVIDMAPEHLDARRGRLELLVDLGRNAESLQAADELLERAPDDPAGLRGRAIALLRDGKSAEALAVAERRNELVPLDTTFRIVTLEMMREAKQTPEQIIAYAQALRQAHVDDPRFELLLAAAYAQAGDSDNYVQWLKKAAAHEPIDDVELVELLVKHLDFAGLYAEGMDLLNRSSALSGEMRLTVLLANRWAQMERWPELSERLVGIDPASPLSDNQLLALRAIALIKQGQAGEAEPILAALGQRRDDATAAAWSSLIPTIYAAETAVDPRRQLLLAEDALARVPANPYFADLAADAYVQLGEAELAMRIWRQVAHLAPAWSRPHLRTAQILLAQNRQDEGRAATQEALRRAPNDPVALTLFATYAASEITPRTYTHGRRVHELLDHIDTLSPTGHTAYLRVLALWRAGQTAEAREMALSAINGSTPLAEETLLAMAQLSASSELGIEDTCIERINGTYGATPRLVAMQAQAEQRAGRSEAGRALIEHSISTAPADQADAFRRVLARYLEQVAPQDAAGVWRLLADAAPADTAVQWEALTAASLASDRETRDRLLTRLAGQIGEKGVAWRVARAVWMLEGEPSTADAARAAAMLGEAVRITPDFARARVLLAEALHKLQNDKAAIEQLAQAAETAPDDHDITLRMSSLLLEAADFTRARTYARRVLESASATVSHRQAAAVLLAEMGDVAAATSALQQSLAARPDHRESNLTLARLLGQRGDHEQVDRILNGLLKEPDEATLRLAVGHYFQTNRPERAAELIEQLDAYAISPASAAMIRADYHSMRAQEEEAFEQLTLATDLEPANEAAWRALMLHHLGRNDVRAVRATLNNAAVHLPAESTLGTLKAHAEVIERVAEDDRARPVISAMIRSPIDTPVLAEALGVLAADDRTPAGARAVADRLRPLADRNVRSIALQVLLARVELAAGQIDDAVHRANRLLHASPNDTEAARSACNILFAARKWEQLLVAARQWEALYAAPQPDPDLMLARAYIQLNQPVRALRQVQPYLGGSSERSPEQDERIRIAAIALAATGESARAGDMLRPVLAADAEARGVWMSIAADLVREPEVAGQWLNTVAGYLSADATAAHLQLAQAWNRLARRTNDSQHRSAAAQQLAALLQLEQMTPLQLPQDIERLALLCEAGGDLESAERLYRRALNRDNSLAISANNLAMIVINRGGDPDEAVKLARRAVEVNPRIPNFHDTLGQALARTRDAAQAARSHARAVELDPRNARYTVSLASALIEAEQPDQAKAALNRLQSQDMDPEKLPEDQRQRLDDLRAQLGL